MRTITSIMFKLGFPNVNNLYYHLRSTVKHERFFAQVYFSNVTVSQTTVSTEPMKMFRLKHETMRASQTNVTFVYVMCRFSKFEYIFSGFFNARAKYGWVESKQIWTNISHLSCA